LGKVSKGEKCSFCSEPAVKSLSAFETSKYFKVEAEARGRVYLCKKHYKEYKKKSEKARELERLRW
jgi:ABC-type transport system involved in Fe-S cluster assembly fused permease/ATPase subunit